MGEDTTRIVKTIRFHPTELDAINAARGAETFTGWVLEAVHQRLGTPTPPQVRAPARRQNRDDTTPAAQRPWTDDVIPPGAGCPVCGSNSVGVHQTGCLYAQ